MLPSTPLQLQLPLQVTETCWLFQGRWHFPNQYIVTKRSACHAALCGLQPRVQSTDHSSVISCHCLPAACPPGCEQQSMQVQTYGMQIMLLTEQQQ